MKPIKEIEMGDLRSAVKALNDSGLLAEKIRVAGVKKEEIVKQFTDNLEALGEKVELPAPVVDFYNILYADEAEDLEPSSDPEPEKEEEPEPKEKKEEQPKAERKKETRKPMEKSCYGHRVGSQAGALDDLLYTGATMDEMVKAVGSTRARVGTHIQHLKQKRGLEITNEGGVYKVK